MRKLYLTYGETGGKEAVDASERNDEAITAQACDHLEHAWLAGVLTIEGGWSMVRTRNPEPATTHDAARTDSRTKATGGCCPHDGISWARSEAHLHTTTSRHMVTTLYISPLNLVLTELYIYALRRHVN